MRSLLFLDFDGPLNHNDWWHTGPANTTPQQPGRAIEPEPAAVVNQLSAVAHEIWIISSWARWMYQHGLSEAAFCEMVFAHGLIFHPSKIRHFGARADQPADRARFIGDQLSEARRQGPVACAIVDDCDMGPHLGPWNERFMRVDSRFMLRRGDAPRLLQWLQTEVS